MSPFLPLFCLTTDPLDNVTNVVYENFGRKTTVKQPNATTGVENTGPQSSVEYDSIGNLIRSTDPLNRATTFTYDALNRLASMTGHDPDGVGGASAPVTLYGYNKLGETTSVTDPLGHVTTYMRDYRGRVTQVTHPDPDAGGGLAAPQEDYEYDAASQLIGFTDAMDHETTYELDDLGRVIEVTSPDPDGAYGAYGAETDYEFDEVGRLVSMSDLLGNKTEYEYDAHDNRITTIDANLQETTSTFDDLGNMLSLTDPESNTTAWVYDGLNRVTTETNELNDDRLFDYDIAGNLSEKTDRNGRVTQYTHDHLNRLTAELWKSGGSTIRTLTYTYDAAGQLSYAGDAAAEYDFIYDGLGRATSITADLAGLTPDVIFSQAFDARGNRSSLSATINTTLDFLNSYTYDNLDRLTQVTQAGQGGGNTVAQKRVNFTYNALSQFSTIVRYANTAGTQHVATTTFGYDAANRLTDMDHARGGTALAGYDFGYDEANRLTSLANTQYSAESATSTYDDFGQLIGADRSGGGNDEAYNYDDNGNRETANGATYTVGANNQIESDGTYDYEYDYEGNRTAKETIATGAREEYDWDYRNRLTKITFRNGGGTVIKVVEQSYDIFNHWIRRNLDADGPGGSAATDTFFLYDGNQIALEFDAAAATDVSHRYLWGPTVDQILADEAVASVGSAGDILWPLTDHLNTVRDLATFDPAAGGGAGATTIANHIAYESFGKVKSETNSAVDHFFGFTGRAYDTSTGLQNNGERIYDALTATSTYAYDDAHRLISLDHARGGTALAGYDFGYDVANRLTSMTNTQYAAESATYDYDDFGQLVGADRTGSGNDESYAYDDNGNRDTANGDTYSIDPNNQVQSDGTYTYEYDPEGNRTAKETIATGEREEYDWDYRNRLVKVTFKDALDNVTKVVEQSYDAFNRWIRRNLDADGPGGAAATDTFFIYDGTQIALEFDADTDADVSHRYLWGPNTDQILADEAVAAVSSTGDLLWPLTDHLNTVRDLAEFDPSASGGTGATTIANHIAYASFGTVASETNPSVHHVFGFTGRLFDITTGLQNNWHRWYDAATGQWISQDPIGFAGGDTNLGRYVHNSPTDRADPYGLTDYGATYGATSPCCYPNWSYPDTSKGKPNMAGVPSKLPPGYWIVAATNYDGNGTGHSWCALIDNNHWYLLNGQWNYVKPGTEYIQLLSFYPTSLMSLGGGPAIVNEDDLEMKYVYAKAFSISKADFDALNQKLIKMKKDLPKYNLGSNNCTTTVAELLESLKPKVLIKHESLNYGEGKVYTPMLMLESLKADTTPKSVALFPTLVEGASNP